MVPETETPPVSAHVSVSSAAADWPTTKQTVAPAPTTAPSNALFAYAKVTADDEAESGAGAVAATHAPQGAPERAAADGGTPPAHAVNQPERTDAPDASALRVTVTAEKRVDAVAVGVQKARKFAPAAVGAAGSSTEALSVMAPAPSRETAAAL